MPHAASLMAGNSTFYKPLYVGDNAKFKSNSNVPITGATIAALASILTLAMGESEETVKYATFGYFILATLIMFLSAIVAFTVLKSNYLSFTLEVSSS